MNLNIAFIVFFLLFSVPQEIVQNNKSDFSEIIQKKDDDYFSLKKKLKKLSFTELTDFYKLCVSENYKIGEIYALNNLGIYFIKKGDYKEALEYHNIALALCKRNNFIGEQMICLNHIGSVYTKKDDVKNALVYHQSVLVLEKQIKIKTIECKASISKAQNSLGTIYRSLKQYTLALEQFEKAIKLEESTQNIEGLAISYQSIGKTYEDMELFDKALSNYKRSLSFNTELNSNLGIVICNNSIASIAIKKGNYNKALLLLEKNYPLAKKNKNKYYVSETLANLGWAQLKLNDHENAYNILNGVLDSIDKLENPKLLKVKVLYHLSELFENKNELEQSLSYNKKAIEVDNKITKRRNGIYIYNLLAKRNLQSQINNFKELESETEIKSLQLTRNRNILIITLVTIALLSVVLYSVYRQHLLKNDQKILLLEQQALQTQMNPHFVFNALNSIKLYIINNEQKNAVYYLNKFSKLIRNILEVSKVKEVSLKEELSTMGLYMSIENIRFDNSIDYTERIHPDLNTDTIKLPPLVLQPFLENALWHGLSSKEGKREIVLSAQKKTENLIEITIVDNGIGRDAALEIKRNKSLKRNSVGIGLTRERLTAFCSEFSNEFSLKYHDLKDLEGNSIGTKVSIQIPLS